MRAYMIHEAGEEATVVFAESLPEAVVKWQRHHQTLTEPDRVDVLADDEHTLV